MSGQSVVDRLNAAKHSLSGQGLAKAICKASTEEVNGPKRKHLDYLLQCTHEANVSVPQMADLLIQRTQTANWVVVFKALITVHNIMNYGNERFYQYLASNNCAFHLENFLDKAHPQGYDMSTYIRKYAKYLNEKAMSYRVMAFDFCKVKRGKDDGLLRTMAPEKLLKALPVLQAQIDALLEFDPGLNDLNNGVINAAFLLMFKDLIRLFACYNDGIINLLEKYFDLNRKQCKEGLDIYKKFLVRMDKTAEFLKVAEPWAKKQNVGIDKGDIPDLTKAPASLLEALEAHLSSLEGKKTSKIQSKSGASSGPLSEADKKKILEDEEKELQKLKDDPSEKPKKAKNKKKEQREKAQATAARMESLSRVPTQTTQVIPPVQQPQAAAPVAKAAAPSDDLLSLDANPFPSSLLQSSAPANNNQWMMNQPSLMPQNGHSSSGSFASSNSFASAFNQQPSNQDLLAMDDVDNDKPTEQVVESVQQPQVKVDEAKLEKAVEKSPVVKKKKKEKKKPRDNEQKTSKAEDSTKSADGSKKLDEAGEDHEAQVEEMVVKDDVMYVTIGGKKIQIKTKPSASAAPPSPSPEKKSKAAKESKSAKELKSEGPTSTGNDMPKSPKHARTQPIKEEKVETKVEPPVMDLLGDDTGTEEQVEQKKEEVDESSAESSADEADEGDTTTTTNSNQTAAVVNQSAYSEFDLLGDLSTPATNTTTNTSTTVQNNDILDLLCGLDSATSSATNATRTTMNQSLAPSTLSTSNGMVPSASINLLGLDTEIDELTSGPVATEIQGNKEKDDLSVEQENVVMQRSMTPSNIMLLPQAERSITPSPSMHIPNTAEQDDSNTTLAGASINVEILSIKPASVSAEPPPYSPPGTSPAAKSSAAPSPNTPKKAASSANPLDILQLFPDKKSQAVKKSLAEMVAEQKSSSPTLVKSSSKSSVEGDLFGPVLQPQAPVTTMQGQMQPQTSQQKLIAGDIDSSLANLAGNLAINPGAQKGNLQWNPATEKKLTGGTNYGGVRPANSTWSQPSMGAPMGAQQQMFMGQQPPMFYPTPQPQNFMYSQPQMYPYGGMRPMGPGMYQGQQPMGGMGGAGFNSQPMGMQQQTTSNQSQNFDPFGSLG